MADFISPASFWLPNRTSLGSGWAEHAPFAFWLVGAMRPKMFVELGTHHGYSFAAFCQAVSASGIGTKCYAVDTWHGDEHAGFYGDEVYTDLRDHIEGYHSSFARLIRSTFDEALVHFDDGSVDLLHIDGRHFFEDVSHDYTTWFPKLAPNSIVIFHDINVHERNFGVYRLWERLKTEHRHFEFLHGNGLGILGIGDDLPRQLTELFELSGNRVREVQGIYSRLGKSVSDHFELIAREKRLAKVEQTVLAAEVALNEGSYRESAAQAIIDAAEKQIAVLQKQIEVESADFKQERLAAEDRAKQGRDRESAAQAVLDAAEKQIAALRKQIEDELADFERAQAQISALKNKLEITSARVLELELKLAAITTELVDVSSLAFRLQSIESSSIWRASRPLRTIGRRFPTLSKALRRGSKLIWWTVTLQLTNRLRLWWNNRLILSDGLLPISTDISIKTEMSKALASAADGAVPAAIPVNMSAHVDDVRPISVPSTNDPLVSIIISTYGRPDITLNCLRSIADHGSKHSFEVLVVDDAYPGPDDMSALDRVDGIKLYRNPINLGFLLSCNAAVLRSKGSYIYMLNNDTELQRRSIDALVDVLEKRPDVGMVGSKLLFPDGRLQEAGGIIWADASGWNYGRGDDPLRPEYNYPREVDYCSGASIMIRRDLFESLGGFDAVFAPAYYEDVDFAFKVRESGMKVLYEPASEVIHLEGMSHGTDLSSGVKAHQVVNQRSMLERWGSTLENENYSSGQHVIRARDRARARKLILVIDHYVPEPDRDAGSRSVLNIIESLVSAGWVVKFWPHNRVHSPRYTDELERQGVEVIDTRWPGDLGSWLRDNGYELDHVLVSRPDVAADTLAPLLRFTSATLSYYGVDLHFARMRRQGMVENDLNVLKASDAMERSERRLWKFFDRIIYPSEDEAAVVREMAPNSLTYSIVPFFFDNITTCSEPVRDLSILFVAGFAHPPNVDAARYLVETILPALEQKIGPVKVTLAGSNPTEAVKAFASQKIIVTGYVTDDELAEFYKNHRVAVVPLRFGAGVKGKVIQSLSHGLPLVTTSVGAQGIAGLDGIIPVHDSVTDMVAALALLLTDDDAWIAQSQRQVAFAKLNYSRESMRKSVLSALTADVPN